jgi:hypothetical protein
VRVDRGEQARVLLLQAVAARHFEKAEKAREQPKLKAPLL